MRPVSLGAILAASTVCLIFGQSTDTRPRFVIADVHPNTGTGYPYSRALPVHDFRYEVVNSTIVDMVRIAYGFDADKIVGGPSWLEMNHYDVTAKLPGETSPDDQKLMLQALLEDRFKLVVHKETKPIPGLCAHRREETGSSRRLRARKRAVATRRLPPVPRPKGECA